MAGSEEAQGGTRGKHQTTRKTPNGPLCMTSFSGSAGLCVTLIVKGSADGSVEYDDMLLFCCEILVGKVGLWVVNGDDDDDGGEEKV